MSKRKGDDRRGGAAPGSTPPAAPFHSPFAKLAGRFGVEPPRTPPDGPRPTEAPPAAVTPTAAPARAVVRLERKGRGGKEATIVEKLALATADREAWLKQLKQGLGCGGSVEGDSLVLQGDLRQRVKVFLEARGVRKVTLG